MLYLLCDENLNRDIVRGLFLRRQNLDCLLAQDINLHGAADPVVLEWAADNNRIVLTHDRATMPAYAYSRVASEQPMPGRFVLNDRLPVRQAIDELLLIIDCSEQAEWSRLVLFLPL